MTTTTTTTTTTLSLRSVWGSLCRPKVVVVVVGRRRAFCGEREKIIQMSLEFSRLQREDDTRRLSERPPSLRSPLGGGRE